MMYLTSSLYSVIAFNLKPGLSLVHVMTVLSLIYEARTTKTIQLQIGEQVSDKYHLRCRSTAHA
jgi:hypothetical protein